MSSQRAYVTLSEARGRRVLGCFAEVYTEWDSWVTLLLRMTESEGLRITTR